jgi:hypothetical protein
MISIALSIDGGHVRAARQYHGRSFEVLLAQVSNDEGKQVVFSTVPAEANSQTRQLRGVLRGLSATPATPVTVLSDGADGPRSLGEAASPGPTHHVLDWFHLAMRVRHVAQAAMSWPDTTKTDRQAGARLAETIERIRWRLWHGQVKRALDLIAKTGVTVDATADHAEPMTAARRKVARLLGDLETYVSGQSAIIDYAAARRREEPISVGPDIGPLPSEGRDECGVWGAARRPFQSGRSAPPRVTAGSAAARAPSSSTNAVVAR